MDASLFDFDLPEGCIAQRRAEPRDSSRLFHIDASGPSPVHSHRSFSDLPELVDRGDVIVLNRTRVVPARVFVRKATGGRGEVLIVGERSEGRYCAMVRLKGARPGMDLTTEDGGMRVRLNEGIEEGQWEIEMVEGDRRMRGRELSEWLKTWGVMPTPPYIKRTVECEDEYQTVYADEEGSIAAPTAGLHFTEALLERLALQGASVVHVVLHIGPGTFLPIRTADVRDHRMLSERFLVPQTTVEAVRAARERYSELGRSSIWAVGTTVMRTLESAFGDDGRLLMAEGETDLFIIPGHRFSVPYKGFITNFHLPRSTPLVLTSAFYDREALLSAYREAVSLGYRFFSFGDAMMIRRRN